jgi:hypothetical protein
MTDPIRAALDKAAEAVRVSLIKDGSCLDGEACSEAPCKCARDAAANAIIMFNLALPNHALATLHIASAGLITTHPGIGHTGAWWASRLAEAVLAAAKDQAND